MEKNLIQNKQIVETHFDELYVSDDVLEKASAARYQVLTKNQNYVIRKNWKNLRMNENQ
jgi:hypothetical protein